jgi:hypothetical protein
MEATRASMSRGVLEVLAAAAVRTTVPSRSASTGNGDCRLIDLQTCDWQRLGKSYTGYQSRK